MTERERQVRRLPSMGRPTRDIAGQLGVSSRIVHNHLSNVLTRLQVADRAQAFLLARDSSLTGQ